MAVALLELDEEFKVAVARALVEAPQCALVAAADPASSAGHLVLADTYEEAVTCAEEYLQRGWHAAVWEVPTRRPVR